MKVSFLIKGRWQDANTPIFVKLTRERRKEERRKVERRKCKNGG